MIIQHLRLDAINGSLVELDGVKDASFDEIVNFKLDDGTQRTGRIVKIDGEHITVQVFEGTRGISLQNASTSLTGKPMEISLSPEILGRVFDGLGRPIDGLGEVYPEEKRDVNGAPINPVSREYPRNFIQTGISSIDALATLIRGQKLPIFSGSGMKHNELAVQIVRQSTISDNEDFAIVFAAMGVKNDVANYFRTSFEEANVMNRVVMFLNLSNDPIIERIMTPRCALTAAEYLAFTLHKHILVILTDMTSYAEALREFSAKFDRTEVKNDDITHPIPDLTGYITEGQIVLDRDLDYKGIYPPVNVLSSLSRLMKDGIGEGFTREDHSALSNQLLATYAKVQDAKSLASVIGEDELSPDDKLLMKFGKEFDNRFLNQSFTENRTIDETLDLGWELLSMLPRRMLDRVDDKTLDKYYKGKN